MKRKRPYEDKPFRNHEGYYDPTAYLAVRNCSRDRYVKRTTVIILEEDLKKKRKRRKRKTKKPVKR